MRSTWKNGTLLAAATIFALSGTAAFAQKENTKGSDPNATGAAAKTTAGDARFAKDAAIGGMTEVEMGKIAVKNGSNDKVKQFGQRMIDDHSKASDQLKSVAAKDNITLPTELDAKHKAMVDKYAAMTGTAFDRAYMRDMVKDHQTDVADFQKESNSGSNYDLKNWAGATLPTLQEHLRLAKDAESSLGTRSSK
jgi:putative membrane protein